MKLNTDMNNEQRTNVYIPLPLQALEDAGRGKLTARELQLYAFLLHRQGKNGKTWVSNELMAQSIGCQPRMICKLLKGLVEAGYIHRKPTPKTTETTCLVTWQTQRVSGNANRIAPVEVIDETEAPELPVKRQAPQKPKLNSNREEYQFEMAEKYKVQELPEVTATPDVAENIKQLEAIFAPLRTKVISGITLSEAEMDEMHKTQRSLEVMRKSLTS